MATFGWEDEIEEKRLRCWDSSRILLTGDKGISDDDSLSGVFGNSSCLFGGIDPGPSKSILKDTMGCFATGSRLMEYFASD